MKEEYSKFKKNLKSTYIKLHPMGIRRLSDRFIGLLVKMSIIKNVKEKNPPQYIPIKKKQIMKVIIIPAKEPSQVFFLFHKI